MSSSIFIPKGAAGLAAQGNTVQFFRETPVGQQGWFMSAPIFKSVAVDKLWVYLLFLPSPGESLQIRVFRHRKDPGFTYTQINSTVILTDGTPAAEWIDLSGSFNAAAADYDQEGKNDAITVTTIASAGVGQSLLGIVVGFKPPPA